MLGLIITKSFVITGCISSMCYYRYFSLPISPHVLLVPLSLRALLRLSNNQIKMTLGNLGLDSSRTRKKKGRQSFKVGLYHSTCVRGCVWEIAHFLLWRCFFYYLKWGGERKKGVKEGGGGEGERVGLKSWKRRGRSGELETWDRRNDCILALKWDISWSIWK